PMLYSTFLLWVLSELYEQMPEVGDLEKPKLVFFFDEAHLLFTDAPPALLQKIEQVIRLIRSKGVGIYFVTQNPLDVPDTVLAQLGNRVQHALRAFSPRDQKAVKVAAETLRQNPKFNAEEAIMQLEVGEALISFLDEKGTPSMVERAFVLPPSSRIGPVTQFDRQKLIQASVIYGVYEKAVDRESAYEKLKAGVKPHAPGEAPTQTSTGSANVPVTTPGTTVSPTTPAEPAGPSMWDKMNDMFNGGTKRAGMAETIAKSVARSASSELGRSFMRGVLGSIFGGRKK
ncbi:MAG: helicase HerA-like domain-containing protein, partial [Planctomycetota bacterium]